MRLILNILIVVIELVVLFVILAVSADPDFSSMARQILARPVTMAADGNPATPDRALDAGQRQTHEQGIAIAGGDRAPAPADAGDGVPVAVPEPSL